MVNDNHSQSNEFDTDLFLCSANVLMYLNFIYQVALARRQRRDLSVFESNCHLPTCLSHTVKLHTVSFNAERPSSRKAVNIKFYGRWFDRPGIKPKSTVSVADALSKHLTTDNKAFTRKWAKEGNQTQNFVCQNPMSSCCPIQSIEKTSLTCIPDVVKYGISNLTLIGGLPSMSSLSTLGKPKCALIKNSFPPCKKWRKTCNPTNDRTYKHYWKVHIVAYPKNAADSDSIFH